MMSMRYILTIILVGTINISVTTADSFDTGFAVGVLTQKVLSKQSENKCKKEVSKKEDPLMTCMDTELEENPITSIKNQHICYEKKYFPTINLSIVEKLIVIIVLGSFMFALISLCIFGTQEDFNYTGGLIIGIIIANVVDSLLNDDEC